MKKILSLILLAVMLTSIFTSCGNIPDNTTTTTTQNGQTSPSGGNPSGGNPSGGNPSGDNPSGGNPSGDNQMGDYDSIVTDKGFEIKGKKLSYTKGNKNALILNVKNTTDKNYSITLTVNYFASDGVEVIKTEKKTFKGFASGYDRYFIFQPEISYDKYSCSIELTEYSGECLEQYIDVFEVKTRYIKHHWLGYSDDKGNAVWGEAITAQILYKSTYSEPLWVYGYFIILDKNGNIYFDSKSIGSCFSGLVEKGREYADAAEICNPDGNKLQSTGKVAWPDELVGDITFITYVEYVSTERY